METEETLYAECASLSNEELVAQLVSLSAAERGGAVNILVHLYELDRRELAQALGYSSIYIFCRRKLRYGEALAYRRTKAAEACHRFPYLLRLIDEGELDVTTVAMLAPYLTRENWRRIVKDAKGRPTRNIERLIASLAPPAPAPARERVSFVAVSKTSPEKTEPLKPADLFQPSLPSVSGESEAPVEVLSKRTFTCDEEVETLLERARRLLWHKYPEGRFEDILRESLLALIEARRPKPSKRARRPRISNSRHIPADVRAAVDARDGDQCAYRAPDGTRCEERSGLEYDHVIPFADGGRSDDPANIRKLCPSHNQWRARRRFGRARRRR